MERKANSRVLVTSVESLLLLLVLMVAVLVTMKPWGAYFFSGLADHWDTKLMGQWMAWNADKIIRGEILLPDFHANFFYPHSYTLAFGDTFWTPSFVYAALYAISHNLFFSFNGTMLFFWALSGVTMFALLRELKLSRVVCYLGAFIFCLMPFRLSYYYLFTATLVFAIPLLFFLLIRWLREPSLTRALLLVVGFWLSLTSNLYYTVIIAAPMLLVFLGYLVANRRLLVQKQFYLSAVVMGGLIVVMSAVYLYPYILLRLEGGYSRTSWDYLRYYVEVAHYLSTKFSAFIPGLFDPAYRPVETVMFPGTVLAVLSVVYFTSSVVRAPWFVWSTARAHGVFLLVKFALWTSFWVLILINFYLYTASWISAINQTLYPIGIALLLLYLLSVCWPRNLSERGVIVSGMAAGAVVCFFLSLGPLITVMVGPDARVVEVSRGPMADVLESVPLFGSVRALARFGIVVYVYLVVASCYVMDQLLRRRRTVLGLCLILPFVLIYEGIDVQSRFRHKYVDYTNIVNSQVIAKAKQLPERSVLFQLPAGGTKRIDATIVMQTIGDFHYLVNGHSGFWPAYYYDLSSWVRDWRLQEVTAWVKELWPPAYLILDRGAVSFLSKSWHKPFPQEELEQSWRLLEQDRYYALYEPKSRTFATPQITQRVRSDVLERYPILRFSARSTTDTSLGEGAFRVRLNGLELGDYGLTPSWQHYEIELPGDYRRDLAGDEVVMELLPQRGTSDELAWEVKDLRFLPKE